MKSRKRFLSVLIASLFVLTAFAVVEMPMAKASTPTQNFSFPYSYGQPQVPSDVGAQGTQGPTVPLSDIGPTVPLASIGPIGKIGPQVNLPVGINGKMSVKPTLFTVNVKNGSYPSTTDAVSQKVTMTNLTTGNVTTLFTNISGTAVFSLSAGWYLLRISPTTATYLPFVQQVNTGQNQTITRYLIPSSTTAMVVNNPSTSTGTLYFDMNYTSDQYVTTPAYPLTVELLNESNSGALLVTGVPLVNGTAEFTHVNTAYSYAVSVVGYRSSYENIKWGITNFTTNPSITFGTNQIVSVGLPGYTGGYGSISGLTTSTGILAGTPINPSAWILSEATKITGGVTYLGYMPASSTYTLTFYNATVYYNTSDIYGGVTGVPMDFFNSTLIFLGIGGNVPPNFDYSSVFFPYEFSPSSPSLGNAIGNLNNSYAVLGTAQVFTPPLALWSMSQIIGGNNTAMLGWNGTVSHDMISNITTTFRLSGAKDIFANSSFNQVGFISGYSNGKANVSIFDNDIFGANGTSSSLPSVDSTANHDLFYMGHPIGTVTATMLSSIFNYEFMNISFSRFEMNTYPSCQYSVDSVIFANNYMTGPGISQNNILISLVNQYGIRNSGNSPPLGFGFASMNADNVTFVHNLINANFSVSITNGIYENNYVFTYLSMTDLSPFGHTIVANNTFGSAYWNYTLAVKLAGTSNAGGNTFVWNGGKNASVTSSSYMDFTHNTFLGRIIGTGVPNGVRGVLSNVTYNLFVNNESIDSGSPYLAVPYGGDVMPHEPPNTHFTVNIAHNYFLNLNNATQVINSYALTNYTGLKMNMANMSLTDNYFYYSPFHGQTYLNLSLNKEGLNGQSQPYNYMISALNGWHIILNSGTLVTNASMTYRTYGNFGSMWIYNVTPDIVDLSGSLYISYSNGLVGGPQPNFTWDGYKYTESVEPTYIQVGANSTKAPPVNLHLTYNDTTGAYQNVSLYMYDPQTGVTTDLGFVGTVGNGNSNLQISTNTTYNPAKQPLDPIFYLSVTGQQGNTNPVSDIFSLLLPVVGIAVAIIVIVMIVKLFENVISGTKKEK